MTSTFLSWYFLVYLPAMDLISLQFLIIDAIILHCKSFSSSSSLNSTLFLNFFILNIMVLESIAPELMVDETLLSQSMWCDFIVIALNVVVPLIVAAPPLDVEDSKDFRTRPFL